MVLEFARQLRFFTQVRFLFFGGVNTVFSFLVYALGIFIEFKVWMATLMSLVAGTVLGFFFQSRYVFKSNIEGRFPIYILAWAFLYLFNLISISIISEFFNAYLAGLIVSIPAAGLSFLINKRIFSADSNKLLKREPKIR